MYGAAGLCRLVLDSAGLCRALHPRAGLCRLVLPAAERCRIVPGAENRAATPSTRNPVWHVELGRIGQNVRILFTAVAAQRRGAWIEGTDFRPGAQVDRAVQSPERPGPHNYETVAGFSGRHGWNRTEWPSRRQLHDSASFR